jgi:hypothetical protein
VARLKIARPDIQAAQARRVHRGKRRRRDHTVRVARLKKPDPAPFIACAICLNQRGERVPHTTIVNGYAVCDQHVSLVSQPEFSIFTISAHPRNAV